MAALGAASSGVRLVESGPHFELWKAPDGATSRLDWSSRGVVRLCVAGHGHADFAPPTMRRWDDATRMGVRPLLLLDFWDMPTYDSGMRWRMTPWGVKHRNDADFHVLTRSKAVLIGLAVANVAMSGVMKIYEKRPDFDALCDRHGVPAGSR
jgi:hypothetical protein